MDKQQTATKGTDVILLEPELTPAKAQTENFLAILARAAAEPTVDVAKMQALLDMQERITMRRAEIEFNEAMLAVQKEMPRMEMDRVNSHTSSKYATLTSLNRTVVPIYTRHGFSLSFSTADSPRGVEYIRVLCRCAHTGGFSRDYQHDVALDAAGSQGNANKTKTQAGGSSLSYGRRYLTLLIFNITMRGEDDDGNNGDEQDVEYITADQILNLNAMLDEITRDPKRRAMWKEKLLKRLKVANMEDILAKNYEATVREIQARIRQESSRPPEQQS